MKHVMLGMAALLMLGIGALQQFDSGPPPMLVQPLAAADAPVSRFPGSSAEFAAESPLWPPEAYQASNAAIAIFTGAVEVQRLCGASSRGLKPTEMILGCEGTRDGTPILVLPNPCMMPRSDFYAAIACHELGHENGWRHG